MNIVLLLCSFAILVFIWVLKSSIKTKAQKQAERDAIFEDEMIYDPDSGRELTIEEAESTVVSADENRLIPDDELEKYFDDEYHEVEYLRRLFASHNLTELEDVTDYVELLNRGELMHHYDDYSLRMYEIKPGIFLGWADVSYTVGEGRNQRQYSEYQWIIIIDHPVSQFTVSGLPETSKFMYETIGNTIFIKCVRMAKFEEGKQLFDYLRSI